MAYALEKIEGIGPVYAAKLLAAGVKDTEALLALQETRGWRQAGRCQRHRG